MPSTTEHGPMRLYHILTIAYVSNYYSLLIYKPRKKGQELKVFNPFSQVPNKRGYPNNMGGGGLEKFLNSNRRWS